MAKKQLKDYKFVPAVVPPAFGQFPNAVSAITANREYIVEEILGYIASKYGTPSFGLVAGNKTTYAQVLLAANKEFIKEEANAWVVSQIANSISPFVGYNYTITKQTKCKRDIGYLIDAFLLDLAGGGNFETIRIARMFYLNGEAQLLDPVQEAAVHTFVRDLIAQFVFTNTAYASTQGFATQVTNANDGEADAIAASNVLNNIVINVITTGLVSLPAIVYNYNLAWAEYRYGATKCKRDIAYILEGVGYDIALQTNYFAVFLGHAEANSKNYTADVTTRINAAKTEVLALSAVAASAPAIAQVNSDFTEIVTSAAAGINYVGSAVTFTDPSSATTSQIAAKNRLVSNREFIQAEVNAYVGAFYPDHNHSEAKCARDVGYAVDALCFDILYGGNTAVYDSAMFFNYAGGVVGITDEHLAQTISAYDRLKVIVSEIVLGTTVTKTTTGTTPNTFAQDTSGISADAGDAVILAAAVQVIADVVANGNASLPATRIAPAVAWSTTPLKDARTAIIAASTTIQNTVVDYVDYVYNQTRIDKCRRDSYYVIDSYIYDMVQGGNSLSYYVASQYQINNIQQVVNGDIEVETQTFARNLINNYILTNIYHASYNFANEYQTLQLGVTAEATADNKIIELSNIIINCIDTGLSSLPAPVAPDNRNGTLMSGSVGLLESNKRFIQEEAIAYIQFNIDNNIIPFVFFTYNAEKCRRDISYVLEGYISDLKNGGNQQTTFNASKYFEGGVAQVDGDRLPEVFTHVFIRDLIENFIWTNIPYTPKQILASQVFDSNAVIEIFANTRIKELSNTIINVIQFGLDYLPATVSNRGYVKIPGFYKSKEFLLITNTTRNEIMYSFADPLLSAEVTYKEDYDSDFPGALFGVDKITTLSFSVNTSHMMVTDNIQIFVESKYQEVRLNQSGTDAMERMRVGIPQSMLDADFEYGLQPTKWQALALLRNYPSIYEIPGSDQSVISVVTDASSGTGGAGASLITVTTVSSHGLVAGDAFTIKALANTINGFSRAEGSFLVSSVPAPNSITYFAKSKVGTSNGQVLATSYTQLRKGAFYTNASVGAPAFSVFSSGSSGTITTSLITPLGATTIGFTGSPPPIGSPLSGTGVNSGTQVTAVTGSGGAAATTKLATPASISDTSLTVVSTTGISQGLIINRGDGEAVIVTGVSGQIVSLSGPVTSAILGTSQSYAGKTQDVSSTTTGTGGVFTVSRSGSTYTTTVTNPGSSYTTSDTVKILGTELGGTTTTNDATITITASPRNFINAFGTITVGTGGWTPSDDTPGVATAGVAGSAATVDIVVDGVGVITAVTVGSGGVNYQVGNIISITQGGTGATVDITVDGSSLIDSVTVASGGTGYQVNNIVSINQSGTSNDATFRVVTIGAGGSIATVDTITQTAGGVPYTAATGLTTTTATTDNDATVKVASIDSAGSIVTVDNINQTAGLVPYTTASGLSTVIITTNFTTGRVQSLTSVTAGSGYITATGVPTTGAGTGLTVNIVANAIGGVTDATLVGTVPLGTGYSEGVVTTTGGTGTGATFLIQVSAGGVIAETVNNPGTGYTVNDVLTLVGGDNTVTITVNSVSNGAIISRTVSNPGSGYNVGNTVTIVQGSNTTSTHNVAAILANSDGAIVTVTADAGGNATALLIENAGSGYKLYDRIQLIGGNSDTTVQVTDVGVGGLITGVSTTGTPITAPDINFVSAFTISEPTTAQLANGNTALSYSSIATIQITFAGNHGFVPGSTITVQITSSGTGAQFAAGAYFVEQVPASNIIRYTARAAGNIDNTLVGNIYARPDSFFVHRPFDGGVQLGTASPAHGATAIRMSKKYIRYQSGKGVQYNTGALFAPSYDLRSITAAGTAIGSVITVTTDDTDHGCQIGGVITINGVETFGYDGEYTVINIINERVLQILAQKTLASATGNIGSPCYMSIRKWHGATVRSGIFDDQNGMFWQYDGQRMAVVRRSSTFQIAGTIDITPNQNLVTGSNTRFTQQLAQGDRIVIRGMTHIVSKIDSDTSMTVTPDFRGVTQVSGAKVAKTIDTIVPQEWWNLDTLNGAGSSGYNLDVTKMQMIGIQHTWYGAGFIDFMLRGSDGNYLWAHRFRNSNVNTEAYMRTGNQPVRYEVINEGARGRLSAAVDTTQTTLPIYSEDIYYFPNSGTVYVDNEVIRYTGRTGTALTGCVRASPLSQFVAGSSRNFTAGSATVHAVNAGVSLISNTITPNISHWGSAFMIDGQFDSDRGYIFNYAATAISASVDKTTAFLIRLAPSVSNAIIGDLGEKELLNRAQLLLSGIAITSDSVTGGGAIVIEGVLNPSNYPTDPTRITWTGLSSAAAGGQPSFAQIAAGGSVSWSGNLSTTTATVQGALTTTLTAKSFNLITASITATAFAAVNQNVTVRSFSSSSNPTYTQAFNSTRNTFLITQGDLNTLNTNTTVQIGDVLAVVGNGTTLSNVNASASSISSFINKTGTGPFIVTFNIPALPYTPVAGQQVTVTGANQNGYNGTYTVEAGSTTTSIILNYPTDPGTYLNGGTITFGIFTCNNPGITLVNGFRVRLTGSLGGSPGSIAGYVNGTDYFIINTNGSTQFQLSTTLGGAPVRTATSGAITSNAVWTVGTFVSSNQTITGITPDFISIGSVSHALITMSGTANLSSQTANSDGQFNVTLRITSSLATRYSTAISNARTDFLIPQTQFASTTINIADVLSAATVLTGNQTVSVTTANYVRINNTAYARIVMTANGTASSTAGIAVTVTVTNSVSNTYNRALNSGRLDFLVTNADYDASKIELSDITSATTYLLGGQIISSFTRSYLNISGTDYTRIVLSSVPGASSPANSGNDVAVTITAAGTAASYNRTNFLYFTQASFIASGAVLGTRIATSYTQFPAGTAITTILTRTLGATTVYRVVFTQTSNTTLTAGATPTFQFGALYALPGEQVFSFIANPGESGELSLEALKELTSTAIGGRGTFPNGPDVLAINVYKVSGTATPTNIILRWGEAQA